MTVRLPLVVLNVEDYSNNLVVVVIDDRSIANISARSSARLSLDQLVHVVAYALVVLIVDSQEYAILVELVSYTLRNNVRSVLSVEYDVALSLVIEAVNSSLLHVDIGCNAVLNVDVGGADEKLDKAEAARRK